VLPSSPAAPFRWQDGDRVVAFGRGASSAAAGELGDGFALLSTERAVASAPGIAERAGRVHLVRPGRVDEIAAELLPEVDGELIAGLGGGRIIDTAKAIAAARGEGIRVAAIPTTLSGAEMTRVHRHAAGVAADTTRVRPAVVVNDPALSASQELPGLAASALNALGHAAEAPLTPSALDGAHRLVTALRTPDGPDRDELALGALLCGYAIDSAIYGLHHVLSQTLARHGGIGHGTANAIMLPHSLRALASRFPDRLERFGEALGGDPVDVVGRLVPLTGALRLQEAGVEHDALERCAEEAAGRAELGLTPPAADAEELLGLYEAAW
jgi:alcohol dehydrogenase class IV